MSQTINTVVAPVELYNSFLIDHDAAERAQELKLKEKHIPQLWEILKEHEFTELLEPHLLHRHFDLHEGEILVHRDLHVAGNSGYAPTQIDIAKMMQVDESVKDRLVPLLWMVSDTKKLVAYEFGIKETLNDVDTKIKSISPAAWATFVQEFAAYVQSKGLSNVVALKSRGCLNGGEFVSPGQRTLFRIPNANINLQPGRDNLQTGWIAPKGDPQPTDGHITRTRKTAGGRVAHSHVDEADGPFAIESTVVAKCYTDAMWAAQDSDLFWKTGIAPTAIAA